jgi:predicted amidophosphoribosyltransferase
MAFGIGMLVVIVILYAIVNKATSPTTECGVCGKSLSKRAPICPNCGDPK